MRVKMSKQPLPAPTTSAVGPCPTVIQIVGRPGTGSLPSTIAPPDHPRCHFDVKVGIGVTLVLRQSFLCYGQGTIRQTILYGDRSCYSRTSMARTPLEP